MASITLTGVNKVYRDGHEAVHDLDLSVADGEFVVLVGPSGCGKSTVLRMVAGLEEITAGELRIGDRVVNDRSPRDRDIAMVFQSYALYPHMTVAEIMGFSLRLAKLDKREIRRRVHEAAALLGLEDCMGRRPAALSGGQQQRVAMGRAIVRSPQVFLMDEPLSNLDAKLRVEMRAEIAALQRRLRTTTLYVTHDQAEAMTMGDRVAVLRDGRLQQVCPPQELYARPANLFVAQFVGSPSMNLGLATLSGTPDGPEFRTDGGVAVGVPTEAIAEYPGVAGRVGRDVVVGMRPEHLVREVGQGATALGALRVTLVEQLGAEMLVHVEAPLPPVTSTDALSVDDRTGVAGPAGRRSFVARLPPADPPRPGDMIELGVQATQLHFFDPATGAALR